MRRAWKTVAAWEQMNYNVHNIYYIFFLTCAAQPSTQALTESLGCWQLCDCDVVWRTSRARPPAPRREIDISFAFVCQSRVTHMNRRVIHSSSSSSSGGEKERERGKRGQDRANREWKSELDMPACQTWFFFTWQNNSNHFANIFLLEIKSIQIFLCNSHISMTKK